MFKRYPLPKTKFNSGLWISNQFSILFLKLKYSQKTFIKQQPQIVYKKQCDQILEDIKHQRSVDIPSLSLFQESYLNAQLELVYNIEMPFVQEEYFTNTQEILEYLNEI